MFLFSIFIFQILEVSKLEAIRIKMMTGEEAMRIGRQVLGTVVVNIGSFSLGTALAWPAPALLQLAKEHGLSEGQVGLTGEEQSWVASLMHPGGFAAVLLAGPLMDRFGKKVR